MRRPIPFNTTRPEFFANQELDHNRSQGNCVQGGQISVKNSQGIREVASTQNRMSPSEMDKCIQASGPSLSSEAMQAVDEGTANTR